MSGTCYGMTVFICDATAIRLMLRGAPLSSCDPQQEWFTSRNYMWSGAPFTRAGDSSSPPTELTGEVSYLPEQ